jgi:hypothetical protein
MNIDKIMPEGMDIEATFIYAGECMEEEDKTFSEGDMYGLAQDILLKCIELCGNNEEAVKNIRKHFEI